MDEITNPTEDKELIKAVQNGAPIHLSDGTLLGSDLKHCEKSESILEDMEFIPDVDAVPEKCYECGNTSIRGRVIFCKICKKVHFVCSKHLKFHIGNYGKSDYEELMNYHHYQFPSSAREEFR